MEVFSWLSHSGRSLYGYGAHEINAVETQFKVESKRFVSHHQAVRDYMNDSGWITIWLGELAHAIVLVWGAYAVYQHNNPDPNAAGVTLTTGEYYLLLKIFTTVSKHLRKLNTSFVLLQRGAVCLSRVEKLLNLGLPPAHLAAAADSVVFVSSVGASNRRRIANESEASGRARRLDTSGSVRRALWHVC